jgi:hypothetical protein
LALTCILQKSFFFQLPAGFSPTVAFPETLRLTLTVDFPSSDQFRHSSSLPSTSDFCTASPPARSAVHAVTSSSQAFIRSSILSLTSGFSRSLLLNLHVPSRDSGSGGYIGTIGTGGLIGLIAGCFAILLLLILLLIFFLRRTETSEEITSELSSESPDPTLASGEYDQDLFNEHIYDNPLCHEEFTSSEEVDVFQELGFGENIILPQ